MSEFPVAAYMGETFVYWLSAGGVIWKWTDCEIVFAWDGVTWNRDEETTEQVREAKATSKQYWMKRCRLGDAIPACVVIDYQLDKEFKLELVLDVNVDAYRRIKS